MVCRPVARVTNTPVRGLVVVVAVLLLMASSGWLVDFRLQLHGPIKRWDNDDVLGRATCGVLDPRCHGSSWLVLVLPCEWGGDTELWCTMYQTLSPTPVHVFNSMSLRSR